MKIFGRTNKNDLLLNSVANLAVEVAKMRGAVEALTEAFENSGFTMTEEQQEAEKAFMEGLSGLLNYNYQRDRYGR